MTSLPSPPPPEDLKILGVPMPTNDVGLAGLFLGSTGLFTGLLTALVVYLMARRCRHNGADPDGVKPDESTLNAGASQALTIDSSQVDVMLHLGQMSLGDADDTPPATNSESAATTIWGRTWAGPLLTTPRTDSPRGSGHVGGAGDVAGPSRSAPTLQGGAELASHPMEPVAEDGNPGETVVIGEATGVGADSSMYGYLNTFSSQELRTATDNFAEHRRIGEGGFGAVYSGKLRGVGIAVKRLNQDGLQGETEMLRELQVLGSMQHRHLVALLGWCQAEHCLVYELAERGSLEGCLSQLDWVARTRVATEVCRGLVYLHLRRPEAVLHRDIKPENVLLDAHLTAKLADVGLAKFMPTRRTGEGNGSQGQQNTMFTTTLAGTMGYMDPEYLRTGQVSFASDCYSFGVLLLQMITGRAPESNETPLQEYVEDMLSTRESFTSPAAGTWPADHAASLARLALSCSMARRRDRPNLAEEVLPVLEELCDTAHATQLRLSRAAEVEGEEAAAAAAAAAALQEDRDGDSVLCVVCMDAPSTHAFVPCGHRSVCQACSITVFGLFQQLCPVCRCASTQVIKIF